MEYIKPSKLRIFTAIIIDYVFIYSILNLINHFLQIPQTYLIYIIPLIISLLIIKRPSIGKIMLSIYLVPAEDGKTTLKLDNEIKQREHFFLMLTAFLSVYAGFLTVSESVNTTTAIPLFSLAIPGFLAIPFTVIIGAAYAYNGYAIYKLKKIGLYIYLFFCANVIVNYTIGFENTVEFFMNSVDWEEALKNQPPEISKETIIGSLKIGQYATIFLTLIWTFFVVLLRKRFK